MESLRNFVAGHPHAEDYARFRAVGERRRAPWPAWPAPLRDGVLREGDYDEEARRYVERTAEAKADFSSGAWLATRPFRREEDRRRLLGERAVAVHAPVPELHVALPVQPPFVPHGRWSFAYATPAPASARNR